MRYSDAGGPSLHKLASINNKPCGIFGWQGCYCWYQHNFRNLFFPCFNRNIQSYVSGAYIVDSRECKLKSILSMVLTTSLFSDFFNNGSFCRAASNPALDAGTNTVVPVVKKIKTFSGIFHCIFCCFCYYFCCSFGSIKRKRLYLYGINSCNVIDLLLLR
jgi:hypothetical protein